MNVSGLVANRCKTLICLVSVCTMALASVPAAAQSCIEGLSTELFDTMGNCMSQPSVDRVLGSQIMHWKGHSYLLTNVGNEVRMWQIDDPDEPAFVAESIFDVGNLGDSDYDLMNFSVAADSLNEKANFKSATVLFDLGNGSAPSFVDDSANYDANTVWGGFTFVDQGQQYLIANNLVDECSSGDSMLYEFNGTDETSDLESVACVQASGVSNTQITGGFHVADHLYLGDRSNRVFNFEVLSAGSTINLNYLSTPFTASMVQTKGLAVDAINRVAVEANSTGMSVWDITNPADPVLRSTVAGSFNTASVVFPIAFAASKGSSHSEKTYDISDLNNPQPLDHDFWTADNPWNYPDENCVYVMDGTLSPKGPTLFLSRYSVLQMADLSSCSPPQAPVAGVQLSPDPAFPGDTLSIADTSVGDVQRSAIWVTDSADPNGTVIFGSSILSSTTPGTISFGLPIDVAANDSFWAHVAVETDDDPYDPGGATPDQITSQAIDIDRTPTASISLNPTAPITGDSLTLTATAEGHPSHRSPAARRHAFQDRGLSRTVVRVANHRGDHLHRLPERRNLYDPGRYPQPGGARIRAHSEQYRQRRYLLQNL